jgi:hypothetical protein
MDRSCIISALFVSSAVLGCARSGSESARAAPVKQLERYAELPGLSSSPHTGLKAELALLTQERATPLALDAHQIAIRTQSSRTALSGRQALGEAIPAISRPLLKAQLDEVYRGGQLTLSPVQLERARQVLRRWTDDRARFEQALEACSGGLDLPVADGVLADLRFLEVLQLGCRLEALAAAEALAENQPEEAIVPLAVMLRAARILAKEWNITTRASAANLREDALHVLDAVANQHQATRETHERLLALLTRETSNWPPDAAAWIGDRATGLIVYELVRDGYYFSLLEPAELAQLREDGLLDATAKAVMRDLDGDQMFYLSAQRRIIESCRLPYFQRAPVLQELRLELAALERRADYPLIAGRLLLSDFESAHLRQAEDRARCQGWEVALAAACQKTPARTPTNPITGKPLQVRETPQQVRVVGAVAARDELSVAVRSPTSPVGVAERR